MKGGKREGAGRPKKYGENLKRIVFYIPESKVNELREIIKTKLKTYEK